MEGTWKKCGFSKCNFGNTSKLCAPFSWRAWSFNKLSS